MVFEELHLKRLTDRQIVIVTEYLDGNAVKRRSTDGAQNDDIRSGVVLGKTYYRDGKVALREMEFNPGLLYSFTFPDLGDGRVICPNCGGVGEAERFSRGCPYCGAHYNLEYANKDLGSRAHGDYVVPKKIRLIPTLISILFCVTICLAVTVFTSRTARPFDYVKGGVIGVLVGSVAGLIFSASRNRNVITEEAIRKREKQETSIAAVKRRLAADGDSFSLFTNALSYALEEWLYTDTSGPFAAVVDFDLIDCPSMTVEDGEDGTYTVEAELILRLVTDRGGELKSDMRRASVCLKRNTDISEDLRSGLNIRQCPGCGASLDLSAGHCEYCGSPAAFNRPFTTENVEISEEVF